MAKIEVVMPQMGESIAEGTILKWHKKVGESVKKDETLLEISTDKVDSEIPSPASGVLTDIVVGEQETVAVQTVIAYLETDGGSATQQVKTVARDGGEKSREVQQKEVQQEEQTPAPVNDRPTGTGTRVQVVMPQMGESIVEGTILKWHKKVGESVKKDETLLEISTDKVDSEIPSPVSGTLSEIVVNEQETVSVNTVIAYVETGTGGPAKPTPPPVERTKEKASAPQEPRARAESPKPHPQRTVARFYSPLVLNIARSEGISMEELESIPGTGEGGRVSKKDIIGYLTAKKSGASPAQTQRPQTRETPAPAGAPPGILAKPVDLPELRAKYPAPQHDILQMSNVLKKMAEHMVRSAHTSPHVAAIHEVDMTNVARHRTGHAAMFEQKEGFRLTFMPYIVWAVVNAIKKYPLINSSVDGDKIIRKNFVNLGIAVASDNGLIVPVIKNAEEKNFLGIARALNDIATRTRSKRLTPDDIQGGTFTISNYGVFGTLIGTPIINQPQVAILGTGAIKKRVAVIDDAIAIRSIAYFTLSFDHRIVDGALGGMFLEEVVQTLQNFDPATPL
jgi:2-oxoglutarate dehydrogenase dihydrolipoamide succinyltransferase (E2 component)